jgi:hypothetical protein
MTTEARQIYTDIANTDGSSCPFLPLAKQIRI